MHTHESHGKLHEQANDEPNIDSEEMTSQETKRNHEAVFQETKPRITRRHSYGK